MFGKLKLGKQSPPAQPKTFSLGPTDTLEDDWDLPDVKPDNVPTPKPTSSTPINKSQSTPHTSAPSESRPLSKPTPTPPPTPSTAPAKVTLSSEKPKTQATQSTATIPVGVINGNSNVSSPVLTVRFYGQEVHKRFQGGWWFLLDDLLALASPSKPDKPISKRKDFNERKEVLVRRIDNLEYVDSKGALELMREIDGMFPGPLARWLQESAAMPAPDSN